MKRMLFVLMLPITVFAAKVPDFQCWDISNIGSTTADDRYVTRYLDKMPPPEGHIIMKQHQMMISIEK